MVGGGAIPDVADIHDFKRLEEAVTALVDRYRIAQLEITSLRSELAARDELIRNQDREMVELSQRRQDAAKRLDQLIEELDRLDTELAERSARGAP